MSTDEQIEAERREITKACVEQMLSEGIPISHGSVSARISKTHVGFDYDPKADSFRRHINDSIPEQQVATVEPVVGEIAAVEPTDAAAGDERHLHHVHAVEPDFHPMDIELLRAAIHEAELERG